MAKIEDLPIFLRIEDMVVNLSVVEHFRLLPSHEPKGEEDWRSQTKPMIVFDIENRHYVANFASDADARATYEEICNMRFPA